MMTKQQVTEDTVEYFVNEGSVVREIWGKSDTILFIFAGAAAEFALNKAADWLYFTGKLPSDPLGRFFSTVSYAREIVFSEKNTAVRAIDTLRAIHSAVEAKRGMKIPDWAYRDVLFMLVDYSIRSFELLERRLTTTEKHEVFDVFYRMATQMRLKGLPVTFEEWEKMRSQQLHMNLEHSLYTSDLFMQYRKHLGNKRYYILLNTQALIVPPIVRKMLLLRKKQLFLYLIKLYRLCRLIKFDKIVKVFIQPAKYRNQIKALNNNIKNTGIRKCPFRR